MKTRRLLLLITLAFVPLVASGAKPLVPGRPEYASPEDYTVLRGKITIETIDEHLIGVFVDELQEKGQTAKYRHLFRLQTTQSVSPFRVVSASGSLEFRGNEVVILGTDNDLFYVLMLPEAEANTPRAIGAKATRYVGFGLNHEIRPIATASPGSRRGIVTLDVVDGNIKEDENIGRGGTGDCTSGGANAASCMTGNSYGTCSISCSGHFYACCTAATASSNAYCGCVPNP